MAPRPVIETVSGVAFDVASPHPQMVRLGDIAHALSLACRFGGMCKRFYSVAEHAVLVADLVAEAGGDHKLQLAALHHDDHEAYIGDLPKPLKPLVSEWPAIEKRIDTTIAQAFGIELELLRHPLVKEADALALQLEAAELMPHVEETWGALHAKPELSGGIEWRCGLAPDQARDRFLHADEKLRR